MKSRHFCGLTLVALLSGLMLASTVAAAPITIPNNGTIQLVDVLRRYNNGTSLTVLGGGTPGELVDGGLSAFQWNNVTTSAPVVLQFTLDQIYPLRQFVSTFGAPWLPGGGYDISVSTTGFGSLTSVASSGSAPASTQTNTLASAVNAKYIQYTYFGPSSNFPNSPNAVIFNEFQAFPDASAGLKTYDSTGSFNFMSLQGSAPLTFTDLTPGKWLDAISPVADRNIQSYLRGAGTGDAKFLIDLGSTQMVQSVGLGFYPGQTWGSGIKIEASLDNVNFHTIFNQGSSIYSTQANVEDWGARYLRVTDYAGSTGALTEFEVYTAELPTLTASPANNGLINLGIGESGDTLTLANAITLSNTGELSSELSILSYSLTGLNPAIFDVPDFLPTVLTVGGTSSVQFDVSATLASAGAFSALLTIHTNMGDITYNLLAEALPVPEPSTFLLLGLGGLGLIRQARRRQGAKA